MRTAIFHVCLAFWVLAIGGAGCERESQTSRGRTSVARPNFVVIVLDDADCSLFEGAAFPARFPNIARVAQAGIRFTNCHATAPICCPSRASFFRGQYASKLGVLCNSPQGPTSNGFPGGYAAYRSAGLERNDLAVWLRDAGYRTMLVGKYLHDGFDFVVPPGWDDFYFSLGSAYFGTARFVAGAGPAEQNSALKQDEYRTSVEAADAVRLIHKQYAEPGRKPQPFFLYLAPIAPHESGEDGPRVEAKYAGSCSDLKLPETADVNEADTSDKPSEIARLPLLNAKQLVRLEADHRERAETLKSVDDMLGQVWQALQATGQSENTYIFLTSDHGYALGQHRVVGKCVPYDPATRIPLFVSGPGVAGGAVAGHLLAHFDVTATIVELAGAKPGTKLDAQSFVPLLRDPAAHDEKSWRSGVLIEQWESSRAWGININSTFVALRRYDDLYVQWASGHDEYYDLRHDPWLLDNQAAAFPQDRREPLSHQVRDLRQSAAAPIVTALGSREGPGIPLGLKSTLTGYASDDTGIEQIALTIRNEAGDRYWNGAAWQPAPIHLNAAIQRPGGACTSWSHDLDLTHALSEAGSKVVVAVSAVDLDGELSPGREEKVLEIDSEPPETFISRPTPKRTVPRDVRIAGKSGDNRTVDHVTLVIRDERSGQHWNGSSWQDERATLDVRVSAEGDWHYFTRFEPGRYRIWARAYDQAGNFDATPSVIPFSVGR